MNNETTAATNVPATALFQKAYARMVALTRLDEQFSTLLKRRQELQEELRSSQAQINEEFERMMKQAEKVPAKLLALAPNVLDEVRNDLAGQVVLQEAA